MQNIKTGKYKHFKGNLYEVIGFARHSETLEDLVIYKTLYGEGATWVRPESMWSEQVEVNGEIIKRFEYIDENKTQEEINILFENDNIKVEQIFSYGITTPLGFWYNNDHGEWVSIVKGSAELTLETKTILLKTGDSFFINPQTKHRVTYTSMDCEWLCIYTKK